MVGGAVITNRLIVGLAGKRRAGTTARHTRVGGGVWAGAVLGMEKSAAPTDAIADGGVAVGGVGAHLLTGKGGVDLRARSVLALVAVAGGGGTAALSVGERCARAHSCTVAYITGGAVGAVVASGAGTHVTVGAGTVIRTVAGCTLAAVTRG